MSPRPPALERLTAAFHTRGDAVFADLARLLNDPVGDPAFAALQPLADSLRAGALSASSFADAASTLLDGAALVPGRYATPWPLARFLARQVAPVPPDAVVLDPACGVGHLLLALAEHRGDSLDPSHWHGWDTSPPHIHAARIALWLARERRGKPGDFSGIRTVDALLAAPPLRADVVVANPPFVSIRALCRTLGSAYAQNLRGRFAALRGSFDLYVPFLLALPDWLGPNGHFSLVLPASLWTAVYAAPARTLLEPHLTSVATFTPRVPFGRARVPVQILTGRAARSAQPPHRFSARLDESTRIVRLQATPIHSPPAIATAVRLGQVARLEAGTPGYHAHRTAAALLEGNPAEPCVPFVVSRSIDRFRLDLDRPVRFLGRRWQRPLLPLAALTPGKRRLFLASKVLVAGVARHLEAARDDRGVGLGVGVYAVTSDRLPNELLLALLNSRVVSDWYRSQYQGRELSGGYFGVNCVQLSAVPVPAAWLDGAGGAADIVGLVREREQLPAGRGARLDEELDRLVARALAVV